MKRFSSLKSKKWKIARSFKESIEPEEILLDATKVETLAERKIEVPLTAYVFKVFRLIILTVLLFFCVYSFYFQFFQREVFKALAERNFLRISLLPAARGIIYDRNGRQLVFNTPSFNLLLMPQDLPKNNKEKDGVIEKVAKLLEIDRKEIDDLLADFDIKKSQQILVESNLEHDKVLAFKTEQNNLRGFYLEENSTRQYVEGEIFSHILGYLGKLSPEEAKENPNYFLTERIGKTGLEFFYEKILRGQPGQRVREVDALGKVKKESILSAPQDGKNLILSLDSDLQKNLFENLSKVVKKGYGAAAVVLNPKTGGVLSMVSLPSFDNNIFSQGLPISQYQKIINDSAQPFINRATSGQYAPGSTVKPLVAAAALQEKIISPFAKIFDSGEISIVNQYDANIVYHFRDWKAHGLVNLFEAIAQSCDIYFYMVGGGYGNQPGLGIERIFNYFKSFGFGEKTGIDLPKEQAGLVPNKEWKEKIKKESWYIGDTYHLSIGQGDLLVTPLQLAVATAAIANGGRVLVPFIVDKIIDSDKNVIKTTETKILRENFISQENLSFVREGMRQAVTSGSARLLNNLPFPVGAKTGTAQVAGQANPNAWATAFAPFNDPEIVIVVLVENAGEGSQVAVPIVFNALSEYFKNKK